MHPSYHILPPLVNCLDSPLLVHVLIKIIYVADRHYGGGKF